MIQYEYDKITSIFSEKRVLRKIEQREKEGWELYFLKQNKLFIFGSGGTIGLTAVMRKIRKSGQESD